MTDDIEPEYLTPAQVAKKLGVSVHHVRRRLVVPHGDLPCLRPGGGDGAHIRIAVADYEAWRERHTDRPAPEPDPASTPRRRRRHKD